MTRTTPRTRVPGAVVLNQSDSTWERKPHYWMLESLLNPGGDAFFLFGSFPAGWAGAFQSI